MHVLETERLNLRHLSTDDAEFIIALLNDPSFIRYIADRGVRTVADAHRYILDGPVASYQRFGFGLYLIELKGTGEPIGMCGLVKRESLEDVDIGFAFLPAFRSKGYALESALAVKAHARQALGLERLVAIVDPDNQASIKVLEKLGMKLERMVRLSEGAPELCLYSSPL